MLILYSGIYEALNSPVTILVEGEKRVYVSTYTGIKNPSQEMAEKTCIRKWQHQVKNVLQHPQAEQVSDL